MASSDTQGHADSIATVGYRESRALAIPTYPFYDDEERSKNYLSVSQVGTNIDGVTNELTGEIGSDAGYFNPRGGAYHIGTIYLLSSSLNEDQNYDQTTIFGIMAFDPDTIAPIPEKNIPFSWPWNDNLKMDFDGELFWILNPSSKKVYRYSVDGTQYATFDIPQPSGWTGNYEPRHISVGPEFFYVGYQHSDGRGADKYGIDGTYIGPIYRPSGVITGVCIMTHVQNDGTLWCNWQGGMVKYDETETSAALILSKSNLPQDMQSTEAPTYCNNPSYASGIDRTTNNIYFYCSGLQTKTIITWSSDGEYLGKTEFNPNGGNIDFISPHPEGKLTLIGRSETRYQAFKFERSEWMNQPIARSWDINAGDVSIGATSGTIVEIVAQYNASNRDHDIEILSANCTDPLSDYAASGISVETTDDETLGGGFIAYSNSISIDINILNTTEYWSPLTSRNGGILDICIRSSLVMDLGGEPEVLNFVDTMLALTFAMDATFNIEGIDAEVKDAITENVVSDYSDEIEAYLCDTIAVDVPLSTVPIYDQSSSLYVCVRGKENSVVGVKDIKQLVVSQQNMDDFVYVDGGVATSEEIVQIQCGQGVTDVCVADMQLLGRFFSDGNAGDLTVSGAVDIKFLDNSVRRLGMSLTLEDDIRDTRRAQETIDEGNFNVLVNLKGTSEESSTSEFFEAEKASTLLAAATGFAVFML